MNICNYFTVLNRVFIEGLNVIFCEADDSIVIAENFDSTSLHINYNTISSIHSGKLYENILYEFNVLRQFKINVNAEFVINGSVIMFMNSILTIDTTNVVNNVNIDPANSFIGLTEQLMIDYSLLDNVYQIRYDEIEYDIASIDLLIDSIIKLKHELAKINVIKTNKCIMNFKFIDSELTNQLTMNDLLNNNHESFKLILDQLMNRLNEIVLLNISFSRDIRCRINSIINQWNQFDN